MLVCSVPVCEQGYFTWEEFIEKLIEGLKDGDAPQHKVIIAGHDSENNEILFEPYSIRWERGAVVIGSRLEKGRVNHEMR